jgi:hypothetical protein
MPRFLLPAAVVLAAAGLALSRPADLPTAPPLSDAGVARLRQVVPPAAGEDPFAAIPWETDLWAARQKAAAAGKPILLWEMDGHPLGCG